MSSTYETRISMAIGNTTFALDRRVGSEHLGEMQTASEILAALKRRLDSREITQQDVADVLGVKQPNVSTLFNPVKRTGKPRALTYDEGVALVREFNLGDVPGVISATSIAPILRALLSAAPEGEPSERASQALAVALRHGIALLEGLPSNQPTEEQISSAARAAVLRYREAAQP
ncbi:XRE family transcriptional regulator [Sphingomonas sp. CBMAI 2297]|uniref:XRE family transcriptional regulator n=1 Tax=Sphingomonas sp. CBMAI 2297 TaxID=2991720 RepID=UPI0024558A23|nr:XRE family transcriptional regulator [Sphingomonas sp. CBMAI 2297]MDH4746651.1 XRE family transcriptional regulator [Sphingomonas sp. CBMAI 2297]